jgi:hypothetical protein
VVITPGTCQNVFSSPQKQPSANSAISLPSGYGGVNGVPSTACRSGTGIGVSRPGSASSALTICVFRNPKMLMTPSCG